MTRIATGLVGYGLAGSVFHAPLIQAEPRLRLAAVASRRAEQIARDLPGVPALPGPDALLADPAIELVVIATPNASHYPLAAQALASGKHVVVDKPLAVTSHEARQLIELAARHGRLLSVFHNRRWDSGFLTLRRVLADGLLGEVMNYEARFDRFRPQIKPGWRERGEPGGGVLYDLGAHLIDQALLAFGPVTHVYAEADRRRPGVLTDDDTFVALTHANGVRSHLWVSAVASRLGPRFRVLGDRAAYVKYGLDLQENALRAGRRPDLEPGWGSEDPSSWGVVGTPDDASPAPTERGDYPHFYAAVAAALRGRGEMPVDPLDSIEGLRVIAAARRSHDERRVVTL